MYRPLGHYLLSLLPLPLLWATSHAQLGPYLSLLDDGATLLKGALGALGGALGVEATYDYVVVGGGTAGNTIGTRLAEAGHKVAIIEAGEYYEVSEPVLSTAPAGDLFLVGADPTDANPLADWVFVTEPQAGANGRKLHYARGKCLGGSSALNYMIYQRGTKESYAQWADMVNDTSYNFDELLPYFKKSTSFTPPDMSKRFANSTAKYTTDSYGTGGPVDVSFANYATPLSTWLSKGFAGVGMPEADDFNSGTLNGYQWCASTIRNSDATRSSSQAFVDSARGNRNLKVYINTMARKVLFDENKTAIGVEVESTGITYKIHASKEVILSAGTFQSPQMLMVSGVGPKATLEEYNIEVLADRPGVGQNMWDHIFFGPAMEVNFNTLTRIAHDPIYLAEQAFDYLFKHDGVLSSSVDWLGWEKLPDAYRANLSSSAKSDLDSFPSDWPEVEYFVGNGYLGDFGNPAADQPSGGKQYGTIVGALVAPLSRGNVTITSASTTDKPAINPNWLTHETDVEVALALWRRMREVWASAAMAPAVIGPEYWPGADVRSDEDVLEVIRNSLMTVWHAACTCKMGTADDGMAVVDSQARVFGVHGLRVVDASAFALLPPGHPQSSVYMLAEKIAAVIVNGN